MRGSRGTSPGTGVGITQRLGEQISDAGDPRPLAPRPMPVDYHSVDSPAYADRGLDIIVPIYKCAPLARRCINSLLDNLPEIAFLKPRLVLINDSPDDVEVETLLANVAVEHPRQVHAIKNPVNVGFIRTVNQGLDIAVNAGRHALVVNSDTVTFPKTLLNIVEALSFDPQIGFVSPRSNNASLCTLPHTSGDLPLEPDQAYSRWSRLAALLPKVHFIPTAVGFFLLIRHDVLVNFGTLNETFGTGYEEENDLIMRANKAGIRAAMANHAFAYHAGSASFSLLDINVHKQRSENLGKLQALHPEFLPLVRRYENSAHFRAERLLDGLLPSSSGRIPIAVDLTQLGLHSDGTSEVSISLLRELARGGSGTLEVTAICDRRVFEHHKLAQIQGLLRVDPAVASRYAVAVRTAQPFDLTHLTCTESLAPIVVYVMHDTIAQDCGYLDLRYQPSVLWTHVAKHSNGLAFISRFSEQSFRNRYGASVEDHRFVKLLPTKLARPAEPSARGGRDYVLILGNKFLHKDVDRTARLLSAAYPSLDFCVLSDRDETSANVRSFKSGSLPEARIQHLYRHAAVVVAPSHIEGFGLGIIHALSAGKPVLARRIPATLEILQSYSKTRGVFLFDDSSDMADKLKLALAADRSEVDDSDCQDWTQWTAAFQQFVTDRLNDSDIFTRLVARIEATDLLWAVQRLDAAAQAPAVAGRGPSVGADASPIPLPHEPPTNGRTMMISNKRSQYSGSSAGWPDAKQLFRLEGIDFVNELYRSVLGRKPDPEGENYYLNRLQRGGSKYKIFREIASSDEAAAAGVNFQEILRTGYLRADSSVARHTGFLGRWRRQKAAHTPAASPLAAVGRDLSTDSTSRADQSPAGIATDASAPDRAAAGDAPRSARALPAGRAAHPATPEVTNIVKTFDSELRDTPREPPASRCAIDAVVVCPDAGLLIVGWIDDSRNPLEQIRVTGSNWTLTLDASRIVRLRRGDVENALPQRGQHLFGFLAFLHFTEPDIETARPLAIELIQKGGRWSSVNSPARSVDETVLRNTVLTSIAKLEFFQNSPAERVACLDEGIGDEIVRLNRAITARLVASPYLERFGRQDVPRRGTIIVCLYGKLEFFFLQNCLFSQLPGIDDYEFIYVCNSPELADPLLREARSTSLTYGLTCSIMILPGNAGFGAANNAAAKVARSSRLMMINPDVFPRDADWAKKHSHLLDSASADRTRLFSVPLYYENGSLMHAGMYFEVDRSMAMPEGLTPRVRRTCRTQHYGKGAPPDTPQFLRPRPVPAVTGAFISIERDFFEQLGGFTEDFVFGHYEDADLCLRALEKGTAPWVHDIRMWHLEGRGSTRQPEHEGAAIVNRWIFTSAWLNVIEAGLLGPIPSHPLMTPEHLDVPAVEGNIKLAGKRLHPRN
jgi:GT2 family glycosyltransferase